MPKRLQALDEIVPQRRRVMVIMMMMIWLRSEQPSRQKIIMLTVPLTSRRRWTIEMMTKSTRTAVTKDVVNAS